MAGRPAHRRWIKSLGVSLATIIPVVGVVVGGLWVLFQFAYKEWIEPRIVPAIVQTSTSIVHVGNTPCCRVYEISTKLENKGVRDVTVHASHQVVVARQITEPREWSRPEIARITNEFLGSRLLAQAQGPTVGDTVDYVVAKPTGEVIIATMGNLASPSTQLAPGEVHVNQSLALLPNNYMLGSIRGVLLLSHFASNEVDWYWTVKLDELKLLPMPWLKVDRVSLTRLSECAASDEDAAARRQCLAQLRNKTNELYARTWDADANSYTQTFALDFANTQRLPSMK